MFLDDQKKEVEIDLTLSYQSQIYLSLQTTICLQSELYKHKV